MADHDAPILTSLTEIGREWGLTNRALGDLLRNAGYRSNGKPTEKALDEKLAILTFVGDYPRYFWDRDAVAQFLENSGRTKKRAWHQHGEELCLVTPIVIQ